MIKTKNIFFIALFVFVFIFVYYYELMLNNIILSNQLILSNELILSNQLILSNELPQQKIFIIYYVFINPNNNWKEIIIGQFNDIKDSGMIFNTFHNINLEIILSSCYINITNEAVTITNDFFKDISFNKYNIIIVNDNLYEYPGISHLYTKGLENEDALFVYLHSKGMSFHNNIGRIKSNIILTQYMLFFWGKIINIFNNKKHINKITLTFSQTGFAWFNFFWVRGSYLKKCNKPIITNDRYYYESWLGSLENSSYTDCYNLLSPNVNYYNPDKAMQYLINLEKYKL